MKIEFSLDPKEIDRFSEVPEIKEKEAEGWEVSMVALYPSGDESYKVVVTFVKEAPA